MLKLSVHKIKLLLVAVTGVFILLCGCNENIEAQFANYASAEANEYILKGWVPEILPFDCKNVQVINNIDNNSFYGAFRYNSHFFLDNEEIHKAGLEEIQDKFNSINNPLKPEWFLDVAQIDTSEDHCFLKYKYFYLVLDCKKKQCYYFGKYN